MGEEGIVVARQSTLARLTALCEQLERPDLVTRLEALAQRILRPDVVVCLVGEFKQGKSSLVNALLDQPVCPVDDDLATAALTVVEYHDLPSVIVHSREGAAVDRIEIGLDDLGAWVSEAGNPDNSRRVERAEVGIPNELLARGLTLVDTPGMGGLKSGYVVATLAFLPFADAVLFVTDVSTELNEPELEFLGQATGLCSTVALVHTKIDLYPEWPRIVELDQGHLAARTIEIPELAVSSLLHDESRARHDESLDESSGIPTLIDYLVDRVVDPAREAAASRCDADLGGLIDQLRSGLRTERELLDDPAAREAALGALDQARMHLEHLGGAGAQWSEVLDTRFDDLDKTVAHSFRSSLRRVRRELDERIEKLTTADEWDDLAGTLQTEVAQAMSAALGEIAAGTRDAEHSAVELIAESNLKLVSTGTVDAAFDVRSLWRAAPIEPKQGVTARALRTGLVGVVGAKEGISILGNLCRALPAAAAVMVLANPIVLGVGVLFGGVQLFEERRRRIAARRQAARTQMHEFLDEVEFELIDQIETTIRKVERQLMTQMKARLAELQSTYGETIRRATADAERAAEEIPNRISQIAGYLDDLDVIEATITTVGNRS